MQMLTTSFIGFMAGAIAGSASTALADRYAQPKDFLVGRSQCQHCKSTLRWFELLPIVSWLVQCGRCRSCGWPIGWEVVTVELGAAIVGALAASRCGITWMLLPLWLSLIDLGALVIADINDQLLPDRLIVAVLPLLLLLGWMTPTIQLTLSAALLGLFVGGGSLALLWFGTNGKGIGLGDVKLTAVFGLALGYPLILLQLFAGFVLGGVFAAGLLMTGRAKLGDGTRVAFGPFLIVGYLIALLFGHSLLTWYGLL